MVPRQLAFHPYKGSPATGQTPAEFVPQSVYYSVVQSIPKIVQSIPKLYADSHPNSITKLRKTCKRDLVCVLDGSIVPMSVQCPTHIRKFRTRVIQTVDSPVFVTVVSQQCHKGRSPNLSVVSASMGSYKLCLIELISWAGGLRSVIERTETNPDSILDFGPSVGRGRCCSGLVRVMTMVPRLKS